MSSGSASVAKGASRRAHRSRGMETMARAGYATSGLLHLILGWIVISMGMPGSQEGEASQSGALARIADQPFGAAVLGFSAAAFVALAFWQVLRAVNGSGAGDRVKAAGTAAAYLLLGVMAARFALGMGGGDTDEQGITATIMGYPLGRVAIAAVGAGIVAVGIGHCYTGWTQKFAERLRGSSAAPVSSAVVVVGRVGYLAKGLALGVLGGLFATAAIQADPEEAGGLDRAFAEIGAQPFGSVLLVITGAGIACFGLFCFARARYESM